MEYRNLGHTGIKVSAIALGCEGFVGKSEELVHEEFDYVINQGVNFIDIYSPNPELRKNIGKALTGRREQFVIQGHLCTVWERDQYLRTRDIEKTKKGFNDLLELLNTNYVDVGMIHYVDDEADFQKVFNGPIIDYAIQLKKEGKIRTIGMSSHNPLIAEKAVETGLIDVLLFSINPCYDMQPPSDNVEDLWADKSYEHPLMNIDTARERLYELCERKGVGIDVMKAFAGGDLLNDDSPFGVSLTPVQCIEYALTRPATASVMAGCKSIDEFKAAIEWCNASDKDKDYASSLANADKLSWKGHCMYCGHCAPCAVGIDIAMVNKFYNLTVAENAIPETVADHYHLLTHHASECIECGRCEKNCPFGVEIINQMKKATLRFGY